MEGPPYLFSAHSNTLRLTSIVMVTAYLVTLANSQLASDCDMYNGIEVCYTVPNIRLPWTDAFAFCTTNVTSGSSPLSESVLARVYNSSIQDTIQQFLANNSITDPVWISAGTECPTDIEQNPSSLWRWVYDCESCETSRRAPIIVEQALEQQGCYADFDGNRDLPVSVPGVHTPETCLSNCTQGLAQSYSYAGVQQVQECYCGNTFGSFGPSGGCASDCGNPDFNCGGSNKNFVYKEGGRFGDWGYEQPDNEDGAFPDSNKQFCGASKLNDPDYQYFDIYCATELPFICGYDTLDPCINQTGNYLNTTYGACVYYSQLTETDTWHRARQYCRDRGGDLVTFNSRAQHMEVMSEAQAYYTGGNVHIGLERSPLVWRRINQDTEMSYYNMAPGEPKFVENEFRDDPNCLVIDPNSNFGWKIEPCGDSHYFLCFEGPSDDLPFLTTSQEQTTGTGASSTRSKSGPTSEVTEPIEPTDDPQGSTGQSDGLSQTEIIVIVVLTVLAVLFLIFLILFLVFKKKRRERDSKIGPSPKGKIDARLKATKPESGPLFDINDGYKDMGSTANLMLRVKKKEVPPTRGKAGRPEVTEADLKVDTDTDDVVRRSSDTESVLFSDPDGVYEYAGPPSVTVADSPQGSRVALIGILAASHSPGLATATSVPGQTDSFEDSQNQRNQDNGHEDPGNLHPSQPVPSDSVGTTSPSQTATVLPPPVVDIESVSDEAESVDQPDTESNPSDSDSSPRNSDAPLVKRTPREHQAARRQVERDRALTTPDIC